MGIDTSAARRCAGRGLLAVAALFAATLAHAQNINVVGANSTNDRVYSVAFGGKHGTTTTVDNSDWGSFGSIQSLAFLANPVSAALDLVVADNTGGKIAVYPGDFTTGAPTRATVIWQASQGGPAAPNGLGVDLAGDLFVVSTSAGNPQLWVFPAAGSPSCSTTLTAYPALCTPIKVDSSYAAGQVLIETAIAPSLPANGLANTGDLLVLTSNPATVLDYVLSFASPGVVTVSNRTTLLTLPAGMTPGGFAFWPLDNSLLITNQNADTILRYSCCSSVTAMTPFASNLGGSGKILYKIKTGFSSGRALAFVAQAGSVADLLEFEEGNPQSGPGTLLNTITQNANHPEGVAVTNAAAVAANTCNQSTGCDPTGLITHTVLNSTNGSPAIVENICFVAVDPRYDSHGVFNARTLLVNQVCPGFDNTGTNIVVPAYAQGHSGDAVTPEGFTLVQTYTDDSKFNNTIIDNETTSAIANEPVCTPAIPAQFNDPTLATVLRAPLKGQGSYLVDGTSNSMFELTDGCGSVKAVSNGGSLWGLGFALYLPGVAPEGAQASPGGFLFTHGDNKYLDLEATIQGMSPTNITSTTIAAQLAAPGVGGGLTGCVPMSQSYFDFAQLEPTGMQQTQDYTIAADLLSQAASFTCDTIVTQNLSNNTFVQTTGATPVLNPSGQLRMRFANLYFLVNSRALGNPPNSGSVPAWPPNPAPPPPPAAGTVPCVASGYAPPGGCPTLSAISPIVATSTQTATFNLFGSNNANGTPAGCTLTSLDGTFSGAQAAAAVNPPPDYHYTGTATSPVPNLQITSQHTYNYTLTCPFPNSPTNQTETVSTLVTVYPAPTLSATTPVTLGSPVTLSFTLYNSSGCTVKGDDGFNFVADGHTTAMDTPQSAGTVNYTLTCTTPTATTAGPVQVTVNPGTPTLGVNPASVGGGGPATVQWTLNGQSSCSLSYGAAHGFWPGQQPDPLTITTATGSTTYTSNSNDAASLAGVPNCAYSTGVIFTLTCPNNVAVQACLGVSE